MNAFMTSTVIAMLAVSSVAQADEAEVQALEAKCEAAREVKLKPLRDEKIASCKAEPGKEASYCEQYYSDYGDAKRISTNSLQPRMFNDLPECVAAEKAREEITDEASRKE